jgi:hypothetical protein
VLRDAIDHADEGAEAPPHITGLIRGHDAQIWSIDEASTGDEMAVGGRSDATAGRKHVNGRGWVVRRCAGVVRDTE